jgi:hypothetical protein
MKYRYYRIISWPVFACAAVALALGLLTLGPFMREPGQARLLDGGLAIAKGHLIIARGEFHFATQFVSSFLLGGLDRFLPRPYSADTLVFAGNVFGFVFFWGALLLLLARSARRLTLAVFLPLLLAPAFLDYSAFYASAFTSAAFLFLLAVWLDRKNWNAFTRAGIFLLSLLAVGARADALLVLPLLAMLHSRERNFARVLSSANTWLAAAGGLTALFLGHLLSLTVAMNGVVGLMRFNQFIGYSVFGFGAVALLFAVALPVLWVHRRVWRFYLGLGLALPLLYFAVQPLSPRHCVLGVVVMTVFACARTGRALFHCRFRARFSGVLKLALVAAALLPVFIGVDCSNLHHPKITFLRPTLLPSVAGVAPAGAQLGFAISVKQQNGFLDHNHAVWTAARDTKFRPNAEGSVPYLFSPSESCLIFSIRLQNQIPRRCNLDDLGHLAPAFYCESWSLLRMQQLWEPDLMAYFLSKYSLAPVVRSGWRGVTLMRAQANAQPAADEFGGALWALNQSFGPDEFRLEEVSALKKIPADWAGKKITLASRGEFRVKTSLEKSGRMIFGASFGSWHLLEIPAARAGETVEVPVLGEKIYVAVGAFPAWMSLPKK